MGDPMKIRASIKDGTTEVKILMAHDMETGLRKDAAGAVIPARYITEVMVSLNGRAVLNAQFGPAISKNPFLSFRFRGGNKGDKLTVSWQDSRGDRRTDEALLS